MPTHKNDRYPRNSRAAQQASNGGHVRRGSRINGNRKDPDREKENTMPRLTFTANTLPKQIQTHYAKTKQIDNIREVSFHEVDGPTVSVEVGDEIHIWGWMQLDAINPATNRPWMGWRIDHREDLDGNTLIDTPAPVQTPAQA